MAQSTNQMPETERMYKASEMKQMPDYVDPYQHQKKYIQDKRQNDPKFREKTNKARTEKYKNDPEYRQKKLDSDRAWRDRKRKEQILQIDASSI